MQLLLPLMKTQYWQLSINNTKKSLIDLAIKRECTSLLLLNQNTLRTLEDHFSVYSPVYGGSPGPLYRSSGDRWRSLPKYHPLLGTSAVARWMRTLAPSDGVFAPISSRVLPEFSKGIVKSVLMKPGVHAFTISAGCSRANWRVYMFTNACFGLFVLASLVV